MVNIFKHNVEKRKEQLGIPEDTSEPETPTSLSKSTEEKIPRNTIAVMFNGLSVTSQQSSLQEIAEITKDLLSDKNIQNYLSSFKDELKKNLSREVKKELSYAG